MQFIKRKLPRQNS